MSRVRFQSNDRIKCKKCSKVIMINKSEICKACRARKCEKCEKPIYHAHEESLCYYCGRGKKKRLQRQVNSSLGSL